VCARLSARLTRDETCLTDIPEEDIEFINELITTVNERAR